MGIVFREARAQDLVAVARLAGELGHPLAASELAPRLERVLGDPEHALLVADEDGVVLGWLHVLEFHALTSSPSALVVGFVVAAAARGRGLGRALLTQAEAWARARGLVRMRLRARRERTAAHGFYRALGYRVHGKQLQFRKEL
ncbi:MAG: GNAT family N-acetyltransferase [Planctomycetota bacterium]